MFPALVVLTPDVHLDEGTPLGLFRSFDQMHPGLAWSAIGFAGIAGDAAADNVLPGGGAPTVPRGHMIQIQILPIKNSSTVLAGVAIPLEDVVPGEFDLFFGKPIKNNQHDHPGNPDSERNGADAFRVRLLLRKIMPLVEIEGLELSRRAAEYHLCMSLKEKRQRSPRSADVDCLPEAVQDEHLLR